MILQCFWKCVCSVSAGGGAKPVWLFHVTNKPPRQHNIQIPARSVTNRPWWHAHLTLVVQHGSSVKTLSLFPVVGWLETAKIPATGHLRDSQKNAQAQLEKCRCKIMIDVRWLKHLVKIHSLWWASLVKVTLQRNKWLIVLTHVHCDKAWIIIQLRKQKRMGAIQGQNNGETALINIEHPLTKEDQKNPEHKTSSAGTSFSINKTWPAGF